MTSQYRVNIAQIGVIGVALALIEGHPGGAHQSVCAKANSSELWILEDFDVPACVVGARLVGAVRASCLS